MDEGLLGMSGETVKSFVLDKATHFIADLCNEQQMRQMFVEAGAEVANYERDETEESELRQIIFSEENMKKTADYMHDVDDFMWMQVLQQGIQELLRRSSMSPQNQKRCERHFLQIIQSRIRKKNPELMSRILQMEVSCDVQNMAERVRSMDRRMLRIEEAMGNIERNRYESRQHQRQEGIKTGPESETADMEEQIFEIPKWNLKHMYVKGIFGPKEEWKKEICELTQLWEKEREQYPGWYILPYAVSEKLSIYTSENGLLQQHTVMDLHTMFAFVYEFVWRMETCMDFYSPYDIYHIHEIWKKYMAEIDSWQKGAYSEGQRAVIEKWFYIGQTLLRNSRENGEDDVWKEIYGQLKSYEEYGVNGYIDLQLEKVKYDFHHFDIAAMRRDLSKCRIKKEHYEQRLQILGLRAELNETEAVVSELEQLMKDLDETDRSGGKDHVYFITLQACALQLYSLCTQGMYDYSNEYETHLGIIHAIEHQIEAKRGMFDWTNWKDDTEHALLRWHVKKYESKNAFELNREIVTIVSGGNYCMPAYRFYRVLERLALPYQAGHVTLLGEWELPWMEAVREFSDTLGLFLLCRSTKSDTIKTLTDRSWICCLSWKKAGAAASFLIKTLSRNLDEIGEMEQPYGLGLISNIAMNTPELLIRYMSRCPEAEQRDAMRLLKDLMEKDTIPSSFPMAELCFGILREVSEKVKAQMLDEMLQTKIVEHRTMHGHGDGIDLFAFYFQKEEIGTLRNECRVSPETVEWLLEDPNEEGYEWNTKVSRLEELDHLGLLNEEQRKAYGKLLWRYVSETTGLPKLENFHLFVFEKLPCEDPSKPVCSVKGWFLAQSLKEEFSNKSRRKVNMGEIPYLDELILVCRNMENGYWSTEEVDILVGYIIEYWDILQKKLEDPEINGFEESELCRRAQKMERAAAALCRNAGEVSKKTVEKLIAMMHAMQTYEISTRELGVQMEEDEDLIESICEEMNCLARETAVGAIVASEKYIMAHPDASSSQALFEELIRLLKYRKMPGLISAVCVLHNLAYVQCPIILQEKNLKITDLCLGQLANDIQNENSFGMPIKEVLHVRKMCMSLAFQLFQIKGSDSGTGVLEWKALTQDPVEINEVKNEWMWE
ncbi:MAG: hypothetical protein ACI4EI_08870 [Muricoprocola sp.]